MVHVALMGLGVYLARKKGVGRGERVLVGYGVMWFYVALSVESSIIPIPDVINEHRLYLPMVGVVMVIGGLVVGVGSGRRWVYAVVGLVVMVLMFATYRRNHVWGDEVRLWEDVVRKSPMKARPHNNLALAYIKVGMLDRALQQYNVSLRLRPDHPLTLYNLGNVYLKKGDIDRAATIYKRAILLDPKYVEPRFNLAVVYKKKGMIDEAIREYREILERIPDSIRTKNIIAQTHYNLANALLMKGERKEAKLHYIKAKQLLPELQVPVY
ncbi:MAG: tetratricopeptide repeat protein [Nitrospirae bacterium]|nr:MAG: tetratricopeptide repeat protein [Nitrospirota bacterium]